MPYELSGQPTPNIPAALAALPSERDPLSPSQRQEVESLAEDFVSRLEELPASASDEEYLRVWNEAQSESDARFKARYGTQAWMAHQNQAWLEANNP